MIDVILAVIGGGGGAYGGGTEIRNIKHVEISYIGKYIEYPLERGKTDIGENITFRLKHVQ